MRTPFMGAIVTTFLLGAAVTGQTAELLIPAMFKSAGDRHGVPAAVIYAMARTESGRMHQGEHKPWPWTLNVAGKGQYYDTRRQACSALKAALVQTLLVDVGMGQLNIRWNPDLFGPMGRFSDPCAALDPDRNLDAAAAILRAHYDNTGDWLTAAGRYQRPAGGDAAKRYERLVAARLDSPGTTSLPLTANRTSSSRSRALNSAPVSWIKPVTVVWITPGG